MKKFTYVKSVWIQELVMSRDRSDENTIAEFLTLMMNQVILWNVRNILQMNYRMC